MTETFFPEKFADRTDTAGREIDPTQVAPARAWGAQREDGPIQPMVVERRALRPDDIAIDVLYCGVCHSDIHMVRGEWGAQGSCPTVWCSLWEPPPISASV